MIKKEWNILGILLVFTFMFSASLVSSAVIQDDLHVNIQTTDGSGKVVTGTFNFEFNISTSNTCSPVVYSTSANLATDSRGIISYYLQNVNLDYSNQYYLCYSRDGVLIDTSQIARTPYAFRAEFVNSSGIEFDSNLDMTGFNLTADFLFGDGSGLTNIGFNATAINYWLKSGNDIYYNNGNVGIGTSSPGYKLHIYEPSATNEVKIESNGGSAYLILDRSSVGVSSSVIFETAGISKGAIGLDNDGTDKLYIGTDGSFATKWMTFDNGNVGIGTSSPQSTLNIDGGVGSIETGLTFGDGDTGIFESSDDNLFIRAGGANWRLHSFGQLDANSANGFALISGDGTSTRPVYALNNDADTGIGRNAADSLALIAGGVNVLNVLSSGRVGIGNTNPVSTLHIEAPSASTGTTLTIDSNYGESKKNINFSFGDVAMAQISAYGRPTTDGAGPYMSFSLSDGSSVIERMRVTKTGFVGIGTTSPSKTLEVRGEINVTTTDNDISMFMENGVLIISG